jgi:hypothetical protein
MGSRFGNGCGIVSMVLAVGFAFVSAFFLALLLELGTYERLPVIVEDRGFDVCDSAGDLGLPMFLLNVTAANCPDPVYQERVDAADFKLDIFSTYNLFQKPISRIEAAQIFAEVGNASQTECVEAFIPVGSQIYTTKTTFLLNVSLESVRFYGRPYCSITTSPIRGSFLNVQQFQRLRTQYAVGCSVFCTAFFIVFVIFIWSSSLAVRKKAFCCVTNSKKMQRKMSKSEAMLSAKVK